jgi:parallel beta-helix repeat protein
MHRSLTTLTVITLAAMLIAALATATGASAAVTCAKWASTGGSDANPGTQAAPYRSLGTLAASLQPGQTGCLPAGQTYYAVAGNGFVGGTSGTSAAPVTITSGPWGRATVMGQIELKPESHDVVLTGLDFKGGYAPGGVPFYTKQTHLLAAGDRISIVDNDISDPRGICVGAGHGHATAATPNDVAEDLKITGNRIHDCGMAPDIAWGPNDSGSHGIYLENTLRARISDNLIFRNRWRGLQLWPKNDGAVIERNLFDENATHVNIGSSLGEYGGTFKAQNTIVRDNILTGRVTDFVPSQNPSQVYGFFPEGSPTYGNQVSGNCFAPGDAPEATGA